ncbi:9352_t:CDS:2 [Acaulospora morrowiae]|uniref:9352_t:CDS:1 n=1 Tax=Acaulospora morrowiae TaxID=94023 RepID=A0A9N8ZG55_9GLOM|nr:9352_t:CDS:2 [Acaulospora morrowiae]
MSIKTMPILSDPAKNLAIENTTRSYDKAFNSSAMDNRKRHACSNSQGVSTSSSVPSSSSLIVSPSPSQSKKKTCDDNATENSTDASSQPVNSSDDVGVIDDLPVITSHISPVLSSSKSNQSLPKGNDNMISVRKTQPPAPPRIATTFVNDAASPLTSERIKKFQHQRVTSDEDALITLPSPATSVHDFPASHHIKHSSIRKRVNSTNLNVEKNSYPHHLSGHRSNSSSEMYHNRPQGKDHSHNDEVGPLNDHSSLQRRLNKLGLANAELIGHYAIIKAIGSGSFSEVKLAMDLKTCKKVAIKMITLKGIEDSDRLKTGVWREVELLKFIDHPNIVSLIDTIDTPSHLCLVLEYVPGGELFDFVNDYYDETTEEDAKHIFLQIVDIVSYLHNSNIVHRDLKLENILLESAFSIENPTKPVIKLTDFGLAKFIDPTSPLSTTRCGSEEYAAPELILAQPYDGRKTDIWALGIILYSLLVGYLPFNQGRRETRKQFCSKIARGDFSFPRSDVGGRRAIISEEAKDLVKRILQRVPEKRPSLSDIKNHPCYE